MALQSNSIKDVPISANQELRQDQHRADRLRVCNVQEFAVRYWVCNVRKVQTYSTNRVISVVSLF